MSSVTTSKTPVESEAAKMERLQKRLDMAAQKRRELNDKKGLVISTQPGISSIPRPASSLSAKSQKLPSSSGAPTSSDLRTPSSSQVPSAHVSPLSGNIQVLSAPAKTTTRLSVSSGTTANSKQNDTHLQPTGATGRASGPTKIVVVSEQESDSDESSEDEQANNEPLKTPVSAVAQEVQIQPDFVQQRAISDKSQSDSTKDFALPQNEERKVEELKAVFDPNEEIDKKRKHALESEGAASVTAVEKEVFAGLSRREYCFNAVAPGIKLQCRIIRTKKDIEKMMYPQYELYIEHPIHGNVFLIAARKRKKSKTSNYLIATVKVSSKTKEDLIGKVRSNFLGTEFTLYDNSRNFRREADDVHGSALRKELGAVIYEQNILGFRGPRKMTVICPKMTKSNGAVVIQPTQDSETITERVKHGNTTDLLTLRNKSPQWNEDSQSYVLNFSGRVTLASVKNFQIVHDDDPEYIILQFGRVNDETFTLDFQYPMSPIQAFSIALTSFDAKIACE